MGVYTVAALLASGLLANAVPHAGNEHQHAHLHKRHSNYTVPAVVVQADECAYETYTKTWYGEPTMAMDTPASTYVAPPPASTYVAPPPASTYVAPPPATTSKAPPVYVAPTPATYEAPVSSSAPAYSAPAYSVPAIAKQVLNDVHAAITPSGNKWAMTYTPYAQDGTCKSASDVASDIKSIKSMGFTTVRIYATDCSGPENVGAACAAEGLKIILGVYIDGSGISGTCHEQISTLTTWGADNWSMVEMVVVGNEAVFQGHTDAGSLAAFISDTKSKFQAAGYTGPVTTTETVAVIVENAAIFCPVIDCVAANIHPYFNGAVAASGAGDFVKTELALLESACPGKDTYNLETGWPSAGNANGAAIPGTAEQKEAIDSIVAVCGSKSAIFSFENDTWKAAGNLGVEQYWGASSVFAAPSY
ncbi:unnamed protein product [Zymoseptoria tritici ST99CH_1A5]|uniref:Probable beta-glucosidase btgE n=3 Tax=Zymoseptoria tritici TaxID=1047171 RepID=F9XCE8_ZYMTI|nr:putative glucan 1,3-beta-glucosidase [Zymoseptoria tritici IPO323]EGP87435.1 putative glucan 1,3-beta-glucosidase [Zymoseptoria tritici IPO323]SMQ51237.1 unnamed protein product [Zymoseptoria tritici ST99CH_3D7]SMR54792.1 unnamed protein product [Zymoseptoria tritici ST99CH_3D1]SMY24882.1 unnamed protein product [Zymoseptoria tritici ST99CH_1A5]